MDLRFTELYPEGWGITFLVEKGLHSTKSPYQRIDVLETKSHGRLLVIDGAVMLTERDEFAYHEMLTHVALFSHPCPEKVLVIGGGDGGAVREIARHSCVKEIALVDIDADVIEVSRRFFPQVASGFNDERVKVLTEDGVEFVKRAEPGSYHVIVVDSTDPVGPAVGLFEKPFFEACFRALTEDGIFVAQSGSPYFQLELVGKSHRTAREVFPQAATYTAQTPSYGGLWSFVVGSKLHDPKRPIRDDETVLKQLKYYNPRVHEAAFALPNYILKATGQIEG